MCVPSTKLALHFSPAISPRTLLSSLSAHIIMLMLWEKYISLSPRVSSCFNFYSISSRSLFYSFIISQDDIIAKESSKRERGEKHRAGAWKIIKIMLLPRYPWKIWEAGWTHFLNEICLSHFNVVQMHFEFQIFKRGLSSFAFFHRRRRRIYERVINRAWIHAQQQRRRRKRIKNSALMWSNFFLLLHSLFFCWFFLWLFFIIIPFISLELYFFISFAVCSVLCVCERIKEWGKRRRVERFVFSTF